MKKINLLIIIFLSVLACNLVALAQPPQPQWEDFCPKKYLKADYRETRWYQTAAKKQSIEEENYWVQRRDDFEKKVQQCSTYSSDVIKENCYSNLRVKEKQLNLQHEQEVAIKTQQIINENKKVIDENINQAPSYNDMYLNDHNQMNQSLQWHY